MDTLHDHSQLHRHRSIHMTVWLFSLQFPLLLLSPEVRLIQCGLKSQAYKKQTFTIFRIIKINYVVWLKISDIQRDLPDRIFQGYFPGACHRQILFLDCVVCVPQTCKVYPLWCRMILDPYLPWGSVSSINSYRDKQVNEIGNSSVHPKYLIRFKQMAWITYCQGIDVKRLTMRSKECSI